MYNRFLFIGYIILFAVSIRSYADENFPARKLFPEVKVIALNDLYKESDKVVIVDARSKYEYDTLRIKSAVNIPLTSPTFEHDLKMIRKKTDKPIVFYCNGRTCRKSYQAVRKANALKITNCYAFDAGVFDWTKAYPNQAVLLGHSPVKKEDLIEKKEYQAHLLSPMKFGRRVGKKNVIVLDVRDRFQRDNIGFFPGAEKRVGLDEKAKLDKYIQMAKHNRKKLLIYDAVGKQVRWLQYSIKQAGLKDYYFMKGGAKSFYDTLEQQEWPIKTAAQP